MSRFATTSLLMLFAVALAGCGGSSYSSSPATTPTPSSSPSAKLGTKLATAKVSGVGTVLADARGRTVYVLTSATGKNVPCTNASGCTAVWPPVSGPPYKGWRLYEYTGDSGRGQANGEGIKSFGGTWYALSPSGRPVESSSGGYGASY